MSSAAASLAKTSALQEREPDSQERGPVFGTSSLGSLASYDPATSSWRTSQLSLLEEWEPFSATFPRSGMTRSGTLFQLQPLVRRTGGSGSGSWPTPTAADHLHNQSETPQAWSKRAYEKAQQGVNLQFPLRIAAQMWPTPSASGFECADVPKLLARRERCKEKGTNGNGFGLTLNQAVKVAMYPTPTVQDASNNGGPSQYERNSLPLNAVAGGSLNPTWVEWLMGFPPEWTALDASETPSSRKSSKSSGGRSLKRKRG
jgi:hypothetical protein